MIEALLFEEESTTLDFKQEQYSFINANDHQKSELLKDVLAFANAWRRIDAYILIGVEEVKGRRSKVLGIDDELDDASLQQFVNSKTQRPLIFEYKNAQIEGKKIGLITIPINERPIYLKQDYGKLKRNIVYIRRGSSTDEATPDEIVKMGIANQSEQNIPVLKFSFANSDEKLCLEQNIQIFSKILELPQNIVIPDYIESKSSNQFKSMLSYTTANKNYYRELIDFYYCALILKPIAFCISNSSSIVAIDIKVEILLDAEVGDIHLFLKDELPKKPHKNDNYLLGNIKSLPDQLSAMQNKPDITIKLIGNKWHIDVLFQKVQAGQTVFTKDTIYIASKKEGKLQFACKIFADNLPTSVDENLSIDVTVNKWESNLAEIEKLQHQEFLKNYQT